MVRDGLRLGLCCHPNCKGIPIWRWSGACARCQVFTDQACEKHFLPRARVVSSTKRFILIRKMKRPMQPVHQNGEGDAKIASPFR
jgi:hypothetical protein